MNSVSHCPLSTVQVRHRGSFALCGISYTRSIRSVISLGPGQLREMANITNCRITDLGRLSSLNLSRAAGAAERLQADIKPQSSPPHGVLHSRLCQNRGHNWR